MPNDWKKKPGGVSQRQKQPENCDYFWNSLNSYLPCMCQMALCTLLLHNQNSESHFHAHTCNHCQACTHCVALVSRQTYTWSKTKCHQCQTFINPILQSGTDTKTFSSSSLKIWVDCHEQTSTLPQHEHAQHIPLSPEGCVILCACVCVYD